MSKLSQSRRDFLVKSGIIGGGLMISFRIPAAGRMGKMTAPAGTPYFAPNAFLRIDPDNSINMVLTHVEMGQGIWTTLPMLMAEELDADWKDIKVTHSPAGNPWNHTIFGIQITGGSSSTWSEFDRYREAGATARMMLVQAASAKMGVPVDSCSTSNGYVLSGDKKISYGEIAPEAALLPKPEKVTLRPSSQWKYIGKGVKRLDAPAKVNGTALFGMDIRDEDLLTAMVVHAPVVGGKVKSFDDSKALMVPGVKQVVKIPTGVAVLATNYWAAKQGQKALSVQWIDGAGVALHTPTQTAKYKKLAATDGLPAAKKGNAVAGLAKAKRVIEAEYTFPYLAHAAMEPLNCTVKITGDACEIWTGTQLPGIDQQAAAKVLGFKPEQVKVNTVFLGGGFGRRATMQSDFVTEAVNIAKASGKYIKMVWSREDDLKAGYYRPFMIHKLKAGVDAKGFPVAWRHNIAGQSIMMGTPFEGGMKGGIDEASVEGVHNSPYIKELPDHFVGLHNTKEVVPVLWYRSVGHTHTGYVMETIIDELATAAKMDPVEYRRELLRHEPRHLAALNLVAEKSGWGKAAAEGRFRGVAVHEAFGSYVAQVVEISLVGNLPKIHKVWCAVDCGLAVNPDGVRAQMESGIIFGLAMALYGEISFDKGRVQQNNFYDYKILRMHESPEIEVFIADSNEKMGGAGECAVPQAAPALANAMFAATGKRIYQLPIIKTIPDKV
ncbi:MAG: xanthine dehydrogenase family protein molybdopterin-binding subunit [Chitinophagaceae bacterium]|nr:MAG: xanthine dehydrogenase family protein molybdopterin-binding subunit [Chitinophagaceae bacterium]